MGYAIFIDWGEEQRKDNYFDKWINHGRNVLEQSCSHHEEGEEETNIRYKGYCDECGVSEDSQQPMMNYLYPLECDKFSEDKILKVVNETNCTVIENAETGEYFLTLCGGGMDLSQDIALAYLILEKWIPFDLMRSVISQKDFSISKENYKILKKAILEQARDNKNFMDAVITKWSIK